MRANERHFSGSLSICRSGRASFVVEIEEGRESIVREAAGK
jgi:hypothetical protein